MSATNNPTATTMMVFICVSSWYGCFEIDRLDPQILRQERLVLPNFADHRLGRIAHEEELDDFSVWALTTA